MLSSWSSCRTSLAQHFSSSSMFNDPDSSLSSSLNVIVHSPGVYLFPTPHLFPSGTLIHLTSRAIHINALPRWAQTTTLVESLNKLFSWVHTFLHLCSTSISNWSFKVSILFLFALGLISASARCYIRIRVQKHLSIDDGFLFLAICSMVAAIVIMFTFVDTIYMLEALTFGVPDMDLPSNWIERAFAFHKMSTVGLMLVLFTTVSIKLSFLFLFKSLINRLRYLIIYWWIIIGLTLAIAAYCFAVHIIVCPHFYKMEYRKFCLGKTIIYELTCHPVQCGVGSAGQRTFSLSMSAMILDVIVDLLSNYPSLSTLVVGEDWTEPLVLFIPIRLIWQVRIRWTQKAALTLSLCLTIIIIIIAIIRSSSLRVKGKIDPVWALYWQYITAEVGIIMAALTAFRQFFVARSNEKGQQLSELFQQWSSRSKQLIRRILTPSTWGTKTMSGNTTGKGDGDQSYILPPVPRGTMTGIRTFINGQGRSKMGASRISESTCTDPKGEDAWTLPSKA